jgi:hypothetical protein
VHTRKIMHNTQYYVEKYFLSSPRSATRPSSTQVCTREDELPH